MRPIDATRLVKLVLEERDKIPLTTVERYSFGAPSPYKHGQSMRGGIRKVLRIIEQAPTLDYAPVVHGEWIPLEEPQWNCFGLVTIGYRCSECGREEPHNNEPYCRCGAKMDGKEKAE